MVNNLLDTSSLEEKACEYKQITTNTTRKRILLTLFWVPRYLLGTKPFYQLLSNWTFVCWTNPRPIHICTGIFCANHIPRAMGRQSAQVQSQHFKKRRGHSLLSAHRSKSSLASWFVFQKREGGSLSRDYNAQRIVTNLSRWWGTLLDSHLSGSRLSNESQVLSSWQTNLFHSDG